MTRPVIAVWFSCGAASAVAAKLTIERYGAPMKSLSFECGIFCEEPAHDDQQSEREVA